MEPTPPPHKKTLPRTEPMEPNPRCRVYTRYEVRGPNSILGWGTQASVSDAPCVAMIAGAFLCLRSCC